MKNDILTLTEELIRIPSVSGDVPQLQAVLEHVKKQLPNFPFTAFVSNNTHCPSLIYSNQEKEQKRFKIMLHAHLDMAKADPKQFQPYVQEDKLYGRGAYDTKAAAAAMIYVFKELGKDLSYPLGLQFTTDGTVHTQACVQQQIDHGITANFVITSEGSDFKIINRTKGYLLIKLATSQEGILRMYEAIKKLTDQYPIPKDETEKTTLSILNIETIDEDQCSAKVDIRYQDEEEATILKEIRSLVPKEIEIETLADFAPNRTNPNSVYIKQLQQSAQTICKREFPLKKTYGVSEANIFWQNGIDVVEFGPHGYSRGHINIDDEWVDIKSVEQYYEILKDFLLAINKTHEK